LHQQVRLAAQQQARHAQQDHARALEAQAVSFQHQGQKLDLNRAAEDDQVSGLKCALM